jgi:TolB protein
MIAFFGYDSVGQGLYVIGADGGGLRELAGTYNGYGRATWSPDGKRLAYSANVGQQSKIFVINGDGTNLSVLSPPEAADYDPAWVPAGR